MSTPLKPESAISKTGFSLWHLIWQQRRTSQAKACVTGNQWTQHYANRPKSATLGDCSDRAGPAWVVLLATSL